jgi:hypothetical protein
MSKVHFKRFDGTRTYSVPTSVLAAPTRLSWFPDAAAIVARYKDAGPAVERWVSLWRSVYLGGSLPGCTWRDLQLLPNPETNPDHTRSQEAIRMVLVVCGCPGVSHEYREMLSVWILDSFFTEGWLQKDGPPPHVQALLDERAELQRRADALLKEPVCDCHPMGGLPHRNSCPVAEAGRIRDAEALGRAMNGR